MSGRNASSGKNEERFEGDDFARAIAMKLTCVPTGDIVIVRYERHFAVAEARELKQAGFGQRQVVRVMTGEWRLQARSGRDFQRLGAAVPVDYVGVVPLTGNNGTGSQRPLQLQAPAPARPSSFRSAGIG